MVGTFGRSTRRVSEVTAIGLDLARTHGTDVRGDIGFGEMDVAAQQRRQRFSRAFGGQVHHLHAGSCGQRQHVEMGVGAERRLEVELSRPRFGVFQRFLKRIGREFVGCRG